MMAFTQQLPGTQTIDVVVPVYRGISETRRCIESVLGAPCQSAFELVVVDDATPEAPIREYLDSLARQGRITLLRNEVNAGFVVSANRGMGLHPERDVVLLNSDTEVSNDWLDRLRRCAHAQADIGTVTPFSNNATICSYPLFCVDNPMPDDVSVADLDALFARTNAGRGVDIPTAVGFCMYIRRDCLGTVGLFDAEAFGRGYGEENDFSRRAVAAGWRNVLCGDVFVFHQGRASFGSVEGASPELGTARVERKHPGYVQLIQCFVIADAIRPLRTAVDIELALLRQARRKAQSPAADDVPVAGAVTPAVEAIARPVQLHVAHALGGGVQRWIENYCDADRFRRNLVLRPVSCGQDAAEGLALYEGASTAAAPLRVWKFSEPIGGTVVHHPEYRQVLDQVVQRYAVGAILVSSLIGHALDALDTGLPCVYVLHDYYPYCPAINIHFGAVCRQCDVERLTACHEQNHAFNVCQRYALSDKLAVRERFLELIHVPSTIVVAPTRDVLENLRRLDPRLASCVAAVLPHGQPALDDNVTDGPCEDHGRLRVLVLGRLSASKGVDLLQTALESLRGFADIHLLGAGDMAELFRHVPGVHIIEQYSHEELQRHVRAIRPHVGLLMSVWPETFSYTLSELFLLGVPPVATNLGAFRERIRDEVTGFLFAPNAEALTGLLRRLNKDRAAIRRVRANLDLMPRHSVLAMVADYHHLLPCARSASKEGAESNRVHGKDALDGGAARTMLDAARHWQECRKLEERLAYCRMAGTALAKRLAVAEVAHRNQAQRVQALQATLQSVQLTGAQIRGELAGILASTSWRITGPVRWLGRNFRRTRTAAHCLAPLLRHPGRWRDITGRLLALARLSGWAGVKQAIAVMPHALALGGDAGFGGDPHAFINTRLLQMRRLPKISILTPVFNTPESMLRAMLESVRAQHYPNWQLCIADDGSTAPHVRVILQEYAARDPRIKTEFSSENKGVSHATNRALAMARGEFAVLLDHDDLLESQALFRVAEAVVEDDPDMLYSDESLVEADGATVQHLIFRPMFSPEYLRAHPYIVHLVGFRTRLLRELGGLDERLRISQDYDLILRASERAQRIVHVAELLYRWRIHGASAGHAMMDEVTETSSAILRSHLQRCGEVGEITPGPSFNFFDVRYPLAQGLKVAILIPTRNHADLLRACIESIERTAGGGEYDIIVIDHESDDHDARAYLDSLRSRMTVLRYSGPFNFAAINNWAVSQLDGSHTHLLFCNNDIEAIDPGWLGRMLELGQKADVGIVGAKLYYPDRQTIQHAGVVVACCGVAENLGRFRKTRGEMLDSGYVGSLICNREVSAVTAACMLVRSNVFRQLAGFDESIAVGYGDVDLCLRAGQLGYRTLFCAHAMLLHHESFTRGCSAVDPHPEDTARFVEKWRSVFETGDPYFNPNLSAKSPNWQVVGSPGFTPSIRRRVFERPAAGEGA